MTVESRAVGWRLGVVALAVAAAVVPVPAAWVERFYSAGVYGWIQPWLTALSNVLPFALLDVALTVGAVATVSWWAYRMARAPAGGRLRSAGRLLAGTATLGAIIYLAFLATWGLNYRRVPITGKLDYSLERVSPAALRALADETVDSLNRLYPEVDGIAWPELDELPRRLGPAFARVQRLLPSGVTAVPGRPKPTLLTPYFRRAAVDGMIDPFFLEVLINADVLPFERPAVVAHEWGHLAGYADESEASFVGWLVCQQGDEAMQYSAWLSMYAVVLRHVPRAERREIAERLGPGPREHLRQVAERWRRSAPVVRQAAARVYDRFLKANRVERGIESYDAVVQLLLGTRFASGWIPAPRQLP